MFDGPSNQILMNVQKEARVSSRLQFLILDIADLRAQNWFVTAVLNDFCIRA